MHNIYDCVDAFSNLLDVEYHLVLGRKGISTELKIAFDKRDCFHLMGLQYLKDRPNLNKDREKIFDSIRQRKIKAELIESSDFYYKIKGRIEMLPFLEEMFDSNQTVFQYHQNRNSFSMIQADYLMKNQIENQSTFIFLSRNKEEKYFCRSFFPQERFDYSKNQPLWTVLCKKKVRISTGEERIIHNRLK